MQPFEDVEIPGQPAEFAVSDGFQPDVFLLLDDVFDGAIFDRLELLGGDFTAFALGARILERGGTQQRADMVGTERWLGTLHV